MHDSPFHEGELAVQQRTGERDMARRNSVGLASRIVPGALSFLAQQRVIALTVAGDDRHLWTSVWCGERGFVHSEDGRQLRISRTSMMASTDDPVLRRLAVGHDVGTLAIELTTRRRLRINGTVEAISAEDILVRVRESVPNCPKYIQRRQPTDASTIRSIGTAPASGRALDDERRVLIERTDTAFVGSIHPDRGIDASHRGGQPGFIRALDATTLRIPDYAGNGMFMTLGNYAVDPRASLAAIDFERGTVLSLSGLARLQFDSEDPKCATGGTGRSWDFTVREWVQFVLPALRWDLIEPSPYNPAACRK